MSGRIHNIWLIRVGLARPTIPKRAIADFCKDLLAQETNKLSNSYIGATRDALCEIIKKLNRASDVSIVRSLEPTAGKAETAHILSTCSR